MNESELHALREAATTPGARVVELHPTIVAALVDEIFRLDSLNAGLTDALERAIVKGFAHEIEAAEMRAGSEGDER